MISDCIKRIISFTEYITGISIVELEERCINTGFLSLSERSLKREQKYFREECGIIFKDDDLNILNFSGLSFCWSYTNENNEFIYGGYLLNGLFEALAQESDFWDVYNSVNRHEPDGNELAFLKKMNWFEKQAWGDDGKYGCFFREPGEFPPKIYFYDNGAYFPMKLTLEEYFDAMIASCGVRGWQYFYIDLPDPFPILKNVSREIVLKDTDFIVKMQQKLFPDKDFSYHITRLEYIKNKLKA